MFNRPFDKAREEAVVGYPFILISARQEGNGRETAHEAAYYYIVSATARYPATHGFTLSLHRPGILRGQRCSTENGIRLAIYT